MNTIKIHFHSDTKYSWFNIFKYTTKLIKIVTNSNYYHVSYEICNYFYESTFFNGVTVSTKKRDDITETYIIKTNQTKFLKTKKKLNKLVGKKYDYKAALIGFFGNKFQNPKALYCSEIFLSILKINYKNNIKFKTNLSPKDVKMILTGIKITSSNIKHAK